MVECKVKPEILSDSSIAYNVELRDGDAVVVIGCRDQRQADTLADLLDDTAWIQIGD